jgi:YidC/Oxa1 family membrane protein insertase
MEEQGRMFLAIALSFLVFFLWSYFFTEKPEVQKTEKATEQTIDEKEELYKQKSENIAKENDEHLIKEVQKPTFETKVEGLREPRNIQVNSPFYSVIISEKGAAFKSYVLTKYREKIDENSPPKEMVINDKEEGIIRFETTEGSLGNLDKVVYKADIASDNLDATQTPRVINFIWVSQHGITIKKSFKFYPDSYLIGLKITIINGSDTEFNNVVKISLDSFDDTKMGRIGFEGPSAFIDNKLEKVKAKKIEEKKRVDGKVGWVSVQDQYFISSIIPKNIVAAAIKIDRKNENLVETAYVVSTGTIKAGTNKDFEFDIYVGPKSVKILKGFENNMDKAVNFGFFDFIGKPCLWLMNFIYDNLIPNYGVAIILLTVLIKILFWPLGTKSYKSMNEMKKLQPIMEKIREKYKDDKKKMNEEIMGLYKTYKVNPLGGCLPMVAQIPVFFALYQMLYGTIELRHAPFFGWIKDLSAPDRLFRFGFEIPYMEGPTGIPVLTIIMGGTMLLQQKLAPPVGDPTQAKMMMFMPIIFTIIFINFSSGLVLYWLVQNTLSIAQQYYVTKKAK